jgi:TPR repeat protein
VPVDYEKAVRWYKKSAKQGDCDGEFALDWCFAKIEGAPLKRAHAATDNRDAAEHGDAAAQNNLAGCYIRGLGIEPDFAKAEQ